MTTPPSYKKVNPADSPILLLALRSDTIPLATVDEYADIFSRNRSRRYRVSHRS
jgi:hypothetical protein